MPSISQEFVKSSSTAKAYQILKDKILSNELPAGFQKTEPEMAELLGMSRTPVREALVRLASEGLVEMIPRRGAMVLPVRTSDMQEIYQLLTILEPEAAAEVAQCGLSKGMEAKLEQLMVEMEAAMQRNDLDAWALADDQFHRVLLSASSNQRLNAIVNNLFDQAHRARMITLRLRNKPVKSTEEHRAILSAIRKGEGELTRKLFREHRMYAAEELLQQLDALRIQHF